jgi:hypothetical protein
MITSLLIGQAVIGWLLADFLSGVVHWMQDRIIPERLPFIGPFLASPARLHHVHPLAFVEGSFLYRNGATYCVVAVVGGAIVLGYGPSLFVATLMIGGALSSQAHFWSHRPSKAPTIIRILQETGLIQSPKQHSRHHRPPMLGYYCALTDILNPILEQVNFWRRIELILTGVGIPIQGNTNELPYPA